MHTFTHVYGIETVSLRYFKHLWSLPGALSPLLRRRLSATATQILRNGAAVRIRSRNHEEHEAIA
jgi:hypothetical protein